MSGEKPRSKEELWETISTVWNGFTVNDLRSLATSVPLACKEVIKQKGAARNIDSVIVCTFLALVKQ